jgi:chemotaxis protein CheD
MAKSLIVGISDQKIASKPDKLVSYALGSCVGICLHDSVLQIAGLAHILLPDSKNNLSGTLNVYKYADTAIKRLVINMESMGCLRYRLTAKISGGANMFNTSGISVGEKNIEAVRQELARLNINIIAEDVGGNYGRTLVFDSVSGKLQVKSLSHGNKII